MLGVAFSLDSNIFTAWLLRKRRKRRKRTTVNQSKYI